MSENQLTAARGHESHEGRAHGSALVVTPATQRAISRRGFVVTLGGAAIGVAAGGLLSCSGDGPTPPGVRATGRIAGEVVDRAGLLQPSLGRIYLMYDTGQQTGVWVPVDATGHFTIENVEAGAWQLRFHAPGVAYVPEEFQHPLRVTVGRDTTTPARLTIEWGWEDGAPMIEIYTGDYFFQEQPAGIENGVATVKIGTIVCWYNVGLMRHTITGPFWDSGPVERTGSFIWIPDRIGTFPYRCNFHQSQMIGTLKVEA